MGDNYKPPLPTGNSPVAMFARAVWFRLFGGEFPFGDTDTVKVDYTGGKYYFKTKLANSIGTSQSSTIQQFKIVADGGDYWVCHTWDGTTEGSSAVNVAKPYKIRAGTGKITTETIRGVPHYYTYSYSSGIYIRSVYTDSSYTTNSLVERNTIIPSPIPGDIIYATSGFSTASPSTLVGVEYLDLNVDGRAWAEI